MKIIGTLLLTRCHHGVIQASLTAGPTKYGFRLVGLEPLQILPPPNPAVGVRHASGGTPGPEDHQVIMAPSKNLSFIANNSYDSSLRKNASTRPLVIVLGWLFSQKKHLRKYADFYTHLGFDVLLTSLGGRQLLWPRSGSQGVAKEILNFLADNDDRYDSLFVHGFSVGGYLWGEILVEACRHPERYPDLRRLVKGHVWDSIVDWYGVPRGVSIAMFPQSRTLQKAVQKSFELFTWPFYNQTTYHHKESSRHFHCTPIKSPILYVGSRDDPIGTYDMLQNSVAMHVENGNQVFVKIWPSSPHVTHYVHHKEEYQQEVLKLLNLIGLITDVQRARKG